MSMAAIRFDKLHKSIHGKFEFDLRVYFSFFVHHLRPAAQAKVNPFAKKGKGEEVAMKGVEATTKKNKQRRRQTTFSDKV